MSVERMTLVGAGPVGSLLAILLAQRGYDVEIYERRPDMRRERIDFGRSINVSLSNRGLHALEQAGLAREVQAITIPMRGRIMHPVRGETTYQPYGKKDDDAAHSISRAELNQLLMTAAEATGRVKIHFKQRVTGVDVQALALDLKDEVSGLASRVQVDRLIATDGSASVVRSALVRETGGEERQRAFGCGYKELLLPAEGGRALGLAPTALHIWPRGTFMLIALPNFEGSFTCTLFLPFEGPSSFASLTDAATIQRFFDTQFPDIAAHFPALTADFTRNPVGTMTTIEAWPWHYRGQVLLMGDAAHAIVPFAGQGLNCGLEDCTVLMELLDRQGDWDAIFADFDRYRKPNADAISRIAEENFIEMSEKVADPRFLLKKQVEQVLQTAFPERYASRFSLVAFTQVPFAEALQTGLANEAILTELCRDLARAEDVDLNVADRLIREQRQPAPSSTL